jgi:hypothetical protein
MEVEVQGCLKTMTQQNIHVLEGGDSNQVWRIIGQNFFLKSDINFIRQFFYQIEFSLIGELIKYILLYDAYFEYTSFYFIVVTLFMRNLFLV